MYISNVQIFFMDREVDANAKQVANVWGCEFCVLFSFFDFNSFLLMFCLILGSLQLYHFGRNSRVFFHSHVLNFMFVVGSFALLFLIFTKFHAIFIF